ncbi:alpha/beta fold hydrolase [Flammeovirga yaeyamensis]|uniref:Proline iminopeptidase n=1 Tax=Flammeovirga yaeyamensis TaxID=367791 RepID=A0AAX1NAE5_9BACT|nr:alpha/beta fold hydrolase [Flammeovirga yaeyamensis]MBB3701248.1 proline iminopeptidase [Flammeovirga yaeyamensis]NMF38281.1 alpha/beta fold hydrolase [Flammeovirga yaeyamensis]QWG02693.1 alpha/beta fold hydrolase [Flammeovirga yaeyamensis]
MQTNYLKVSSIHTLYYEDLGNRNATPIIYLHGGPGAGFTEMDKRFFDFDQHRVIFYDQRGSARSQPFGCIEENTTDDLVEDIHLLMDHLEIEKAILFGASWGTTLATVFAIRYPQKVDRLILRAFFAGNQKAISHYVNGGLSESYAKEWERFIRLVPKEYHQEVPNYYLSKLVEGSEEEQDIFAYEWVRYEISVFKKGIKEQEIDPIIRSFPYQSFARMGAHYLSNNCFLEMDYILHQIDRLENIPITLIHGEEDAICPIALAKELVHHLKNVTSYFVEGGHSDREPNIENKIMEVLKGII